MAPPVEIPQIAGFIKPPPPGWTGLIITLLQCTFVPYRFATESTQPTPISKFSPAKPTKPTIPARTGTLIVNLPACLIASYAAMSKNDNIAAILLALHFARRTLEALVVHVYSGTMEVEIAVTIGIYMSLVTLLITSYAQLMGDLDETIMKVGIVLFVVGEVGNLYHHYLLKTLRKDGVPKTKERRYVPPRGGLFEYVAAPHYFFEIVAWLGIALVAQQLNAFVEVLSHAGHLMGRAYQTKLLYIKLFPQKEWPRSRKAIIPFIY